VKDFRPVERIDQGFEAVGLCRLDIGKSRKKASSTTSLAACTNWAMRTVMAPSAQARPVTE